MKKLKIKLPLTFLSFILVVFSNAFYRMEGLFHMELRFQREPSFTQQSKIRPIEKNLYSFESLFEKNDSLFTAPGQPLIRDGLLFATNGSELIRNKRYWRNYFFNYNRNTGYVLIHESVQLLVDQGAKYQLKKYAQFLYGELNYGLKFYLIKNWLKPLKDGSYNIDEAEDMVCDVHRFAEIYDSRIPYIQVRQTIETNPIFKSDSGVEVNNQENKVEINFNKKSLDFQKALINYYDRNKKFTDLAQELGNSQKREVLEKFTLVPNVGKLECTLLEKSKILAVYEVVNPKYNRKFKHLSTGGYKESIIVGLAEDNNTKEKFIWITDLEKDISALFD